MKFGISVDGIDQTINNLDTLQRKIKQAESSMKANLKAFDDNGKSVESLGQKTKDLNTIMTLEEKKMKVLESRRDEAIKKYGAESKQVDNLNTQINKSIARYNGYSSQLGKTTNALDKQLVSSSKYGKQIEANNKVMEKEIAVAKKSGNEVDIVKAKQKAYTANLEVANKAVAEQTKEVDRLGKEYGENSKEVEDAKRKLQAYSRTSSDTEKDVAGLADELEVAEKAMKGVASESKGASKESGKLDGVMNQLKKTVGGLSGTFKKGFSGITSAIGSATKGVGKFLGAGALGAVAGAGYKAFGAVTGAIDGAIKRMDIMANSTRAFENMGFSTKDITKGMEDLQKATKGLPTSLSDAVSNVQLLSSSTEDIGLSVGVFKALNDGILGFGGSTEQVDNAVTQLSQSFSNGKVDAGTWNSMINANLGPTLSALAKQMGKTTGELKEGLSSGNISVKDFQEALIDLDVNGGGGLKSLEQIAKDSTKGMGTSIENMKSAITRGVANMIEGFNKSLAKMGLPSIQEWIANTGEKFETFLTGLGDILPQIASKFKWVGDIFSEFSKVSSNALGTFFEWAKAISGWFSAEGAIIDPAKLGIDLDTAFAIEGAITRFKEALGGLWEWVKAIGGWFSKEGTIISPEKLGISLDTAIEIGGAVDSIKKSFSDVKDAVLGAFDFGKGESSPAGFIDTLTEIVKYVTGTLLPKMLPVFANIMKVVSKAIQGIVNIFKILVSYFKDVILPILIPIFEKIWGGISEIFSMLANWWDSSGERIMKAIVNFLKLLKPLFEVAGAIIGSFVDSVIGFIRGMVNVITGIVDVFAMVLTGDFTGLWDTIKQIFFGAIEAIWNWINLMFFAKIAKGVTGLATGFKSTISGMWTAVKKFFTSGIDNIIKSVVKWISDTIKKVTGLKTGFSNLIKGLWNSVKTFFTNGISGVVTSVQNWISNVLGKVTGLKTSFSNTITDLWKGIKKTFSGGIDTIVKWMTDLPKNLGKAISNGASHVKDAFKGIFNGALSAIGGPVNGIIGGANWVLEKFGAKKIAKWEVPKYANGTDGHPGGPMLVNDGRGAEIIERPNGQMFLPRGKNVLMNGEKGTKVYTAEESAKFLGHSKPRYAYAKGTGESLWDKITGTVGDVWDFMKDPLSLAKKALTSAVDFTGISHVPLDMAKGMLETSITGFTGMVKRLFDEDFSTEIGSNGVYKYLESVAKHLMSKFSGLRVTSGYREGDPYSHGSRNAIDVAFDASMNGSKKNEDVANYAFDEFSKKIGYVITNGRVRDREGTSGTGIHNGWANWPDGDHYDHIHLNGIKKLMGNAKNGTGEKSSGSGASRWRSTVAEALYMTGQYSPSNLAAMMNQLQTESNGDPYAINDWDINAKNGTPSKGLMQVIDPTFRQYAMRGYNTNIYDPLSNMLASIRYSLARYGSLTNAYRGVGYANGGIVRTPQMADLAENGYPEVIIPTEPAKRGRAMMLLNQAQNMLGVKKNVAQQQTQSSSNDMSLLISLVQKQNELLQSILTKDSDVYMDGKKVNSVLNNINATAERNKNRDLGLV